jgi:hypothetical protein
LTTLTDEFPSKTHLSVPNAERSLENAACREATDLPWSTSGGELANT